MSNVKMGMAKNFARALRAFFILRTPLSKILNPPLVSQLIDDADLKGDPQVWFRNLIYMYIIHVLY